MWEPREPKSIIQAAEKAAAAGSYDSAEKLLREAARVQEENLGPRHPDLANTLNNLGIVCERTGKSDDAEQYFRRAVSIARTSLEPDHPFVTTSQNNLRDFCEARGKQVEAPAPAPEPPTVDVPPVTDTIDEEPAPEPQTTYTLDEPPAPPADLGTPSPPDLVAEDPVQTSKKFFFRMALGALGPIAMLMVVLAAGLPRLGAPELTPPSRQTPIASVPVTAPPPTAPSPAVTPEPEPDVADPVPAPEERIPATATAKETDEPVARVITPTPTAARPVLVRASLCGDLDDWSCDPADRPVPSGPLFFYTQVKAPTATTIQHRWYQDDHLRQAVELRIEANRSAGYRTYSRNLMKSDSAGNWRVEVRTHDGALLHEERFEVR